MGAPDVRERSDMAKPAGEVADDLDPIENENAGCPFARVSDFRDIARLMRAKGAVEHAPELFAGVKADPVNGEINVREFLGASFMFDEGESHRARRKLLNPLVRADALAGIREDVVLPEADRLMAIQPTEPDGSSRMDLVEFLERVFIHFTARLVGLVDVDTDERIARIRSFAGPIAAGTSSAFLTDRATVNERALQAKRSYVEEYLAPALEWHRDARRRVEAGELAAADIPSSLLSMAVAGLDPMWSDLDDLAVESCLLFAASVGTSTQSIVHTLDFLQDWFADHPADLADRTDPTFLLHALQETIRLRAPFSPYTTRLALQDLELSDGTEILRGQELHIEYVAANRDKATFGDDADGFNPHRPSPPDGAARYGLGFGMGTHLCYGLRVVVGNDGAGGAHVELLRKLLAAGIRPDPQRPAQSLQKDMDKFSIEDIPRYTSYPVLFDRPVS